MKDVSHTQVKQWILEGMPPGADNQATLFAHIESCDTCRNFAALAGQLFKDFGTASPERIFSAAELRQRTLKIQARAEKEQMKNKFGDLFKTIGWIAAVVVIMIVFNAALKRLLPNSAGSGSPAEATLTAAPTVVVEIHPVDEPLLPVSPVTDPGLLLYESNRDGNVEIYLADFPAGPDISARREWNLSQHPANDREPVWSPDGGLIAFVSDRTGFGDIFVVSIKGGEARQLTDLGAMTMMPANPEIAFRHLAWSPDGSQIAASLGNNLGGDVMEPLYLVPLDGTGARALTDGVDVYPAWSPDGTMLAFTRLTDSLGQVVEDILIVNRDGAGLKNITKELANTPDGRETGPAVWSPSGKNLAWFSQSLETGNLCLHIRTLDLGPSTLCFGDWSSGWEGGRPAWSAPNEDQLAFLMPAGLPEASLHLFDFAQGMAWEKIDTGLQQAADLSWNPRGDWLALTASGGASGEVQIYLVSLELLRQGDSPAVFPLTTNGANSSPRWQPQAAPGASPSEDLPGPLETLPVLEETTNVQGIVISLKAEGWAILRSGPGTIYAQVGEISSDTMLTAVGISEQGDWLQVQTPAGQMHAGLAWIYLPLTNYESGMGSLPVVVP